MVWLWGVLTVVSVPYVCWLILSDIARWKHNAGRPMPFDQLEGEILSTVRMRHGRKVTTGRVSGG